MTSIDIKWNPTTGSSYNPSLPSYCPYCSDIANLIYVFHQTLENCKGKDKIRSNIPNFCPSCGYKLK